MIKNNLKEYRIKKGLSQVQVANALGLKSSARVSKWEHGIAVPHIRNLLKIEQLFDTNSKELYPFSITNSSNNYMNDFDIWNVLKQTIEKEQIVDKYPKEGEVWMSTLGKNIGFEQNGSGNNFSRPLLVVTKFNNHMFWVLPLSTKQKLFDFYYNYVDPNGLKVSTVLAQLRLVSIKRFRRKLYELPPEQLKEVKLKLQTLLN